MASATTRSASGTGGQVQGGGLITFAAVLLVIIGCFNLIYAIAAIAHSHVFTANTHYVFANLRTWGWVTLIIGVLMTLAGVGILLGNGAARWLGVAFAFLSAMAHFGTISSFPLWGVLVIAIDITIIYTLTARWMPDF